MAVDKAVPTRRAAPVRRPAGSRERGAANNVALSIFGPRFVRQLSESNLTVAYASDVIHTRSALAEAHKLIKKLARGKNSEADRVCKILEVGLADGGGQTVLDVLMTPGATIDDVREALFGFRDIPALEPATT